MPGINDMNKNIFDSNILKNRNSVLKKVYIKNQFHKNIIIKQKLDNKQKKL